MSAQTATQTTTRADVVHRRCATALRDAADELLRIDRRSGPAGQDQRRRET